MDDWPVWVLGFVAASVVGALAVYLVARARKPHLQAWVPEEQGRQWRHQGLLASLGALDLVVTNLTTAVLQGGESLARELESGLAQAASAASRSEDDELRRLVDEIAARCDALDATGQDGLGGEALDQLVCHLGQTQRAMYRRMEALLGQVFD
jgi:hypothetical protein